MRTYQFQMAGTEHLALGQPYEDRLAWKLLSAQTLVLSLADGMTSCARASEAADLVTQESLRLMCEACPTSLDTYGDALASNATTISAFSRARNAVVERASELGCPVSELGTTLMVVQYFDAGPDDEGVPGEVGGELRYAYVGDGGIIVLGQGDEEEARLAMTPQDLGEGRTHAVTESSWWRTGSESGVRAFLVATDGLLEALLDRGRPNEFARSILLIGPGHDDELDALLGSVAGGDTPNSPAADVGDDRTLFVCWSELPADDLRKTRETRATVVEPATPARATPAPAETPAVPEDAGAMPFISASSKVREKRHRKPRRRGTARKDSGRRNTGDTSGREVGGE